jgi:hypothetical protein
MPARSKTTTATRIPPQFAGLLLLLERGTFTEEARRALAVARKVLHDVFEDHGYESVEDAAARYITSEAAQGPWADLHARLDAIASPPSDADPFWAGDYANVYGAPALLMGAALMFVFLTDDGRIGGAR